MSCAGCEDCMPTDKGFRVYEIHATLAAVISIEDAHAIQTELNCDLHEIADISSQTCETLKVSMITRQTYKDIGAPSAIAKARALGLELFQATGLNPARLKVETHPNNPDFDDVTSRGSALVADNMYYEIHLKLGRLFLNDRAELAKWFKSKSVAISRNMLTNMHYGTIRLHNVTKDEAMAVGNHVLRDYTELRPNNQPSIRVELTIFDTGLNLDKDWK